LRQTPSLPGYARLGGVIQQFIGNLLEHFFAFGRIYRFINAIIPCQYTINIAINNSPRFV
jgi:hypothetical protein